MSLDPRLAELLVCPICKGPLSLLQSESAADGELVCPADQLAFPVRDGIPVMLEGEARNLTNEAAS